MIKQTVKVLTGLSIHNLIFVYAHLYHSVIFTNISIGIEIGNFVANISVIGKLVNSHIGAPLQKKHMLLDFYEVVYLCI